MIPCIVKVSPVPERWGGGVPTHGDTGGGRAPQEKERRSALTKANVRTIKLRLGSPR